MEKTMTKVGPTIERNTAGRQPKRVQKGGPEQVQKGDLLPNRGASAVDRQNAARFRARKLDLKLTKS